MPQEVTDAFIIARKLKAKSDERRRQLQYVAKLARRYDDIDLEQQVNMLGASSKEDPNTMRLEKLRESFIKGGIEVVNAFCSLVADTDRNKLRNLVKKAKEESAKIESEEVAKPNSRALFKYVKTELAKAKVQIPDDLIK